MSWMAILTMLVLAGISAILVMIYGWELWQAFAVVSGGTIMAVLVLLAIVVLISSRQVRFFVGNDEGDAQGVESDVCDGSGK